VPSGKPGESPPSWDLTGVHAARAAAACGSPAAVRQPCSRMGRSSSTTRIRVGFMPGESWILERATSAAGASWRRSLVRLRSRARWSRRAARCSVSRSRVRAPSRRWRRLGGALKT
jgi:hypothetical protein